MRGIAAIRICYNSFVRITVKFFAILRDRAKTSETMLDLPPHSNIAAAMEKLAEQFPVIANDLNRVAIAVNRNYAKADALLHDGDELALIPPVSGGCA
jgi:molybdopterin converting factor subunit 1